MTSLHHAAMSGKVDLCSYLVEEKGADITTQEKVSFYSIIFAMIGRHRLTIKISIINLPLNTKFRFYTLIHYQDMDNCMFLLSSKL